MHCSVCGWVTVARYLFHQYLKAVFVASSKPVYKILLNPEFDL